MSNLSHYSSLNHLSGIRHDWNNHTLNYVIFSVSLRLKYSALHLVLGRLYCMYFTCHTKSEKEADIHITKSKLVLFKPSLMCVHSQWFAS